MKIYYTKINDYYIPNLKIKNKNYKNLNKYGLMKLDYLKKNNKSLYTLQLMKNELNDYLYKIGFEADKKVKKIIKDFVEKDKVINEDLKNTNQLKWVGIMNNYKNCAEEIVLKELIYNDSL